MNNLTLSTYFKKVVTNTLTVINAKKVSYFGV